MRGYVAGVVKPILPLVALIDAQLTAITSAAVATNTEEVQMDLVLVSLNVVLYFRQMLP